MRTSVTLTRCLLQRVVMHFAAGQQFAEHMAHLLADAEQAERCGLREFRRAA